MSIWYVRIFHGISRQLHADWLKWCSLTKLYVPALGPTAGRLFSFLQNGRQKSIACDNPSSDLCCILRPLSMPKTTARGFKSKGIEPGEWSRHRRWYSYTLRRVCFWSWRSAVWELAKPWTSSSIPFTPIPLRDQLLLELLLVAIPLPRITAY